MRYSLLHHSICRWRVLRGLHAPHRKVVGANLGSEATSPIAYPRSGIPVIMHERWKR